MRALTGSIITAGALIGLGLAAIGLGNRYQSMAKEYDHFYSLDRPFQVILVVLILAVLVGLGITFLGLAYHHERRHFERFGPSGAAKEPRQTF